VVEDNNNQKMQTYMVKDIDVIGRIIGDWDKVCRENNLEIYLEIPLPFVHKDWKEFKDLVLIKVFGTDGALDKLHEEECKYVRISK